MYITAKFSVFLVILAVCFVIGFAAGTHCTSKTGKQDRTENQDNQ